MRSVLLRNGLRLRNCFSSPPLLPFSSRNEKRYLSSSLFDDVFGKNHSSKMGKKNRFLSKSFAMWKGEEEEKLSHVPLVALIGRPNVGKSSLFNSFIREPRALISPVAGTTRDRAYGDLEWNGERMSLVDTGGMLGGNECELSVPIHNQTLVAIEEADILVFVVDVMDGLHHVDREIAKTLRKYKGEKKVIVAVNKVDNVHRVALAEEAIFERLGGYEVQQVSAIHRNGVSDLLDSLVLMVQKQKEEKKKENIEFEFESNVLPEEPPRSSLSDVQIKVGIFGKPNVGKSTLLNQLVGSSRVLVNDLAGTTRDPVNEELIWEEPFNTGKEYLLYRVPSSSSSSSLQKKSEEVRVEGEERSGVDGKDREDVALDIGETRKEEEKEDIGILEEDIGDAEKEEEEREREKIIEEVVEEGFRRFRFTLIDTAGVRRRSKHNRDLEHLSTMWALRAIEKCDVALLVLDSQDGGRSQDAHIAQSILEQYKSCIIVVNKWDVTGSEGLNIKNQKEYEAFLRKKFSFVDYVDVVFISALEGYNVSSLLSRCIQIFMKRQLRLSSRNLNEVIRRAQDAHQSPSKGKKSFKIRYGVQSRSSVPSFVFFVNRPLAVHYSYKRYLENTIRSYYGAFEGSPIRLFFRASREEREKKKGMERKGKKRGKRVLR